MKKLNRILLIIAILAGISYVGYLIEGNGKTFIEYIESELLIAGVIIVVIILFVMRKNVPGVNSGSKTHYKKDGTIDRRYK